jgi:hypothetical protein
MKQEIDDLNKARTSVGLAPITINLGDIVHQGSSLQDILEAVKTQITTAWNAAMSTQPVSGQVGGAYTSGSAPR